MPDDSEVTVNKEIFREMIHLLQMSMSFDSKPPSEKTRKSISTVLKVIREKGYGQ